MFILVFWASVSAADVLASANCTKAAQPILYSSDFHWDYPLAEMLTRFTEIYKSPKRLNVRACLDASGQVKLPYNADRGGHVTVPPSFIASIRGHIENALRLEYVDAVFFPDMGHSHFLVPQEKWDATYRNIPVNEQARLYEQMMGDPDLKILYHTAEQLQMRDKDKDKELIKDRRVQERFYTRNLVGDNRGGQQLELYQNREQSMNTASEVSGYYWWGAGFNVSANQSGCFVYSDKGVQRYFDISLYDLEPSPEEVAEARIQNQ